MLESASWDADALAAQWRAAAPFPHVVVERAITPEALARLREAAGSEPHFPEQDELHEFLGSAAEPRGAAYRELRDELASPPFLARLEAITGKRAARVDARGYVYVAGSYLLPHTDHQRAVGRLVSFALYLTPREASEGGELELYECELRGGDIAATRLARRIEPAEGRLVLFDVSAISLHAVAEVTRGHRASIAGWFYPP